MVREKKEERLTLRLGETDMAMLRALADDASESSSLVVRNLIRREYSSKFGDKKPRRS
jgi:hypothetical protein